MSLATRIFIGLAASAAALPTAAGAAAAGELAVSYFTAVERGDPDFHTTGCCVFPKHLVQATLGPGGLPLLSAEYGSGDKGYVVHDVNRFGEIAWWTPGPTIASTGFGVAALPIENEHFFPPNGVGPDNAHGFQTAIFRGILHVSAAGQVQFRVGADDVAFVYLDGALVADVGGVHPRVTLPVVSQLLQPGDYCLALFYADLYPDHAKLSFAIDTPGIIVTAADDRTAATTPARCSVPVS